MTIYHIFCKWSNQSFLICKLTGDYSCKIKRTIFLSESSIKNGNTQVGHIRDVRVTNVLLLLQLGNVDNIVFLTLSNNNCLGPLQLSSELNKSSASSFYQRPPAPPLLYSGIQHFRSPLQQKEIWFYSRSRLTCAQFRYKRRSVSHIYRRIDFT